MALPYIFANVDTITTPQFDANNAALGKLTVIPCAATGTNDIVLTPVAGVPTQSGYNAGAPILSFTAVASSTGSPVRINFSGIGFKNVYKNNGLTAAGANDIVLGGRYYLGFEPTLNSGAGGFVILNQSANSSAAGSVQAVTRNLVISNEATGTPATQVSITADQAAVSDGALAFTTLFSPNVTVNSATSGANGLDTGVVTANQWYALYLIYNPSTITVAGLMSTSFSAPTLPSGYSQYARVGAIKTDAASQFMSVIQRGAEAQFVITSTNQTILPLIQLGAAGTFSATSPTLADINITQFIPPTAAEIVLGVATNYNAGSANGLMVAPNSQYGGVERGPNGTVGVVYPLYISSTLQWNQSLRMVLESGSIAMAAAAGGVGVVALGYRDDTP